MKRCRQRCYNDVAIDVTYSCSAAAASISVLQAVYELTHLVTNNAVGQLQQAARSGQLIKQLKSPSVHVAQNLFNRRVHTIFAEVA